MNNIDDTLNALEDLQSFIRDYLHTCELNPGYSDIPRLLNVLQTVASRLS